MNPTWALAPTGPPGWVVIGLTTLVGGAIWMMSGDDESDSFSDTAPPPTNCPTCDVPPECAAITAEIQYLKDEVEFRHGDLLNDRHDLYRNWRRLTNPHPDHGSWQGHINKFADEKAALRYAIASAVAMGCPVDPDAVRVSELLAPSRPLR